MFRQLATNAGVSIKKGDKVVVSGRLRVRPWIREDGRTGTSVDIDAETVGHDLMWGTAHFHRTSSDRAGGESSTAGDPVDVEASDVNYSTVDHTTGEILGGPGAYPAASDDVDDPAPAGPSGSPDRPDNSDGPASQDIPDGDVGVVDGGSLADSSHNRPKPKRAGRQLTEAPY